MTKKPGPGVKYYPLNFSQITIRMQLFFSRHKQVLQLPITLITDHVFDFDTLKKAVSLEIERNDCMRMQFIRKGRKLMQYFLPEYNIPDIKIYDFTGKTKEDQDAVILADARKMVKFMKNEMYRIFFFKTYNGGSGIYINVTHMCMDATAVFLFYRDLLNVYFALVNGTELPKPMTKFEDCLPMDIKSFQDKKHQARNREFFKQQYTKDGEPFYAAPFGMSLLNKQRKKKRNPNLRACRTIDIFHDKSIKAIYHEGSDFVSRVTEFCKKEQIPTQALFQFAIRTYLSVMNEFNPDISVFIYVNMRYTIADKNSGGTRASCIPMRSIITEDKTALEAMSQILEEMYKVFRHCDYSLMDMTKLLRECCGTKLGTSYTSMMANFVPLDFTSPVEGWKFEAKWEQIGWFPFPLYMLMIPSLADNGMDFYYDYQTHRMDDAMIEKMHKMIIKIVDTCINEPDITVGRLLHEVTQILTWKVKISYEILRGASMVRTYFDLFPQTIATSLASRKLREKLQKKRLKRLVNYAKKNSPFFSELYKDIDEDFKLTDLPPVTKKQMMDNYDSYLTDRTLKKGDIEKFSAESKDVGLELRGKYVVSYTSGSTGLRAYIVNDKSSQNIMSALVSVRAFQARVPFAMLCFDDGFGIDNGIARDVQKKVPFLKHFLRLFEAKKHISELVEDLNKFNPRVISGYPGTLMLLTEDTYIDKLHIKPRLVLVSGEYLSDYCRKKLQETFKCPVHSMYGCTEGGFLAFECKKDRLHINNDWAILEAVDDDLKPVPDGTLSQKTLVTYLGNKIQPIIRYELTDRTILHNEKCECGRAGPWIEVEGRTNDILFFKNGDGDTIKIAPMSIEDILEETPGVQFFQFILHRENKIELRLVPNMNSNISDVYSRVEKRIMDYLKYSNIDHASMYLSDQRPQRNTVSGKFKQVYQVEYAEQRKTIC